MAQTIGLVLAGGEGRRMGRPKGSVFVGSTTLAARAARALHPICGNVLISVAPREANPVPSFDAVEDDEPAGRGPLAGIAAAFASTGQADLLVLACDYPGVSTSLLRAVRDALVTDADLVFPVDPAGRDHPLVALWRRSAQRQVLEALEARSHKVQALFPDLDVVRLAPSDLPEHDLARALRNVNWPSELAEFDDPV